MIDALTFALLASYWENRGYVDTASLHILKMFELWLSAAIDKWNDDGGQGGRKRGLTFTAKFA